MSATPAAIDPITKEVVKNALSAIGDEMALVIMRTAYSPIVRDSGDFSTGLCDRDGRMIASGLTMALHLGSFPDAMRQLLDQYRGDINPGDMFIWNDPYGGGGMHLPDVYIVKPLFHGGTIEGFATTLVHQIDLGGAAPGSNAVFSSEIYQEGLRIPIIKLYDRGAPNRSFFKILEKNTRLPDKVAGDMRAQVAACRTAERAYLKLIDKYGVERFRRLLGEMHEHAEALMREEIAALPDGSWSFTDYLDGFGEKPEPIPLAVTVTIAGSEVTIDWTGSAGEVAAAINCPIPFTKAACYVVLKCLAEQDIPDFEGFMRPIEVVAPEGTIVNPRLPAACAARAIVGWRALDALFGAFARIVPERIPAGGEGGVTFPVIGGIHEGRPYICSETLAGAWGALPDRDGVHGIPNPGGNLTNQPVEMIEALYPIEVTRYGTVENSGGPGRHRGGLAFVREYRLLGEEARLVMRSDRRMHLPYGLGGGAPGTPSWNIVNPGRPDQRILPVMPMEAVRLGRGDVFCHVSAGGGGYGDPLARDPAAVLDDVREERITAAYAGDVYGVVIGGAPPAIDRAATASRRDELRAARADADPQPAFLRHFHAALGIARFTLEGERMLKV
ncbi:MAG: hydantoinase B/oxoprolinase family protein [Alphaproteobacteria bacterium]|nr:hydantoinase B/oxoprolinase family protein [Alphaproteobacteria bacterium]